MSSISATSFLSSYQVGSQRPSPQDRFKQLDTSGDGSVSKAEFDARATDSASKTKLDSIFDKLDTNKDGKVDSSEFTAGMKQMQALRGKGGHHHKSSSTDASGTSSSSSTPASSADSDSLVSNLLASITSGDTDGSQSQAAASSTNANANSTTSNSPVDLSSFIARLSLSA
ncbi:MAG: Calcium sensor EFh [Bacteriovoracaceae bacterium]|nr:Calcium sensor EFh [Bacteriovoracaceae bacterium]